MNAKMHEAATLLCLPTLSMFIGWNSAAIFSSAEV
jgi:hypothetical protein